MAAKDEFDKKHDKELATIQNQIGYIYEMFTKEVAQCAGGLENMPVDRPFKLSDYPLTAKRIEKLIKKLSSQINTVIVNGVRSQWTLANEKNNELCNVVFGELVSQLTKEQRRLYFNNNKQALDTFLKRKENGMNLSQRVWKYADLTRAQIESTLELGIKTGESAQEIARNLKDYLVYPDKLFRRVRGDDGKLHLSQAASQFHPGAGVYRSSYKNALRLAATENNMAYRTADHLRHKQLSFVVGIEIHLSNNHTLNGKPFRDICDDLKGKYPKWFDFKGWHPFCYCFVTTILKTPEEVKRDMDGIDRGSVNEVKEMPPQFLDWLDKNRTKIEAADNRGTLPYFLEDNRWAWDDEYEGQMIQKDALTIAAERHAARTPEQIEEIKSRWHERYYSNHFAKNVLDIATKIPDYGDYAPIRNRVENLQRAYADGSLSYSSLRASAQAVADRLHEMIADLSHLDNPLRVMQEWGIGEAANVENAVVQKINGWKYTNDSPAYLKKKLLFEIQWLEDNKKHKTWQVAQDAYKKALREVELDEFWSSYKAGIDDATSRAKDMGRYDLVAKIKALYKAKDYSAMTLLVDEIGVEYTWWQHKQNSSKLYTRARKMDVGNGTNYEAALDKAFSLRDEALYAATENAITADFEKWRNAHNKLEDYYDNTLIKLHTPEIDALKSRIDDLLYGSNDAEHFNTKLNEDAYNEAVKLVEWQGNLEKAHPYITKGMYEYTVLANTKPKAIEAIEKAIADKDAILLESLLSASETLIEKWKGIGEKVSSYYDNDKIPEALRNDILDAEMTWDESRINAAIAKADEYLAERAVYFEFEELATFDTTNGWYLKWIDEGRIYYDNGETEKLKAIVKKLREKKEKLEGESGKSRDNKVLWEDSRIPYSDDEKIKLKELKDAVLDAFHKKGKDGLYLGKTDELINCLDSLHRYAESLAYKYYDKQKSLYTDAENKAISKAISDYLAHKGINPHSIWGDDIGGIYSQKGYYRDDEAKRLNGKITPEEMSLATRFSAGSTFSNCYLGKDKIPYWKNIWENRTSKLTKDELDDMVEVLENYKQGINGVIDRLPRYDGIVVRGLESDGGMGLIAELNDAWRGTKIWENAATISTSMMSSTSWYTFEDGYNSEGNLILIIHTKTGGIINNISEFKNREWEVMCKWGVKYKILMPPTKAGDNRYYCELEEII